VIYCRVRTLSCVVEYTCTRYDISSIEENGDVHGIRVDDKYTFLSSNNVTQKIETETHACSRETLGLIRNRLCSATEIRFRKVYGAVISH